MSMESQHTEWKQAWRDEYLKWLCGFANAEGGKLIIGLDDDGNVVGVQNAKKLLEDIPNKARDILGIMVDVNLVGESGREFLEIKVEPQPYPVSYKGQYHYRSGSTKQELQGAALDQFLLRKQGRHWDGVPVARTTIGDLDKKTLTGFREQAFKAKRLTREVLQEADSQLLDKLHLREANHLKRAAVLLFHPEPETFVTGAYIKIGYFQDNNADLRYQDEVHGTLLDQVTRTIEILLAKYLKARIDYDGLQRVESYPVPDAALREALLNAVVHKDYASANPVQISVYPDKLMIWNPGQLPRDWTVERLLEKHPSQPFNPDIANTFFRAGLIEAWGRGIERMLHACNTAKMRAPEFKAETTGFGVTFSFSEGFTQATTQPKLGEKLGNKWGERLGEKLGEKHQAILTAMKVEPYISAAKLAKKLGMSATAIENSIKEMKEKGYIQRIGSDRGGHWEVLGERLGEKWGERLGEKHQAIILSMKAEPSISAAKLAKKLGMSATTVENNIRYLKENGYIQRIGPDRGGHWEVLQ